MKGGKQPLGYTVIELLIVLAISGSMFVIANNFISGKQERTSFQSASNEFAAQVQEVIDQVLNGEYPDISVGCTNPGSGANLIFSGSPKNQGENFDCVFLGKVMRFAESNERNKYEIFSLAGVREISPGVPAADLRNSSLTVVQALTQHRTIPENLDVTWTHVSGPSGSSMNTHFAFAFLQGLGSTTTTAGVTSYNSGSQTIGLYYVDNVGAATPEGNVITRINHQSGPGNSALYFEKADTVCLVVSDGHRAARINIGVGDNSQLSVETRQLGVVTGPQTC